MVRWSRQILTWDSPLKVPNFQHSNPSTRVPTIVANWNELVFDLFPHNLTPKISTGATSTVGCVQYHVCQGILAHLGILDISVSPKIPVHLSCPQIVDTKPWLVLKTNSSEPGSWLSLGISKSDLKPGGRVPLRATPEETPHQLSQSPFLFLPGYNLS